MLGVCIVLLWWPLNRAAGLTFTVRETTVSHHTLMCILLPSILLYFIVFSPQFWISCPSWWCHILWSLPAWRQPPFPWRWARWTDWAHWPAWPTWRNFTPTPLPGLPPPSLRWTPWPVSPGASDHQPAIVWVPLIHGNCKLSQSFSYMNRDLWKNKRHH